MRIKNVTKKNMVTALMLMLPLASCREERSHPVEDLSRSQKNVVAMMEGEEADSTVSAMLLSLELRKIIAEYTAGTERAATDEFYRELDSMALLMSTKLLMETDGRKIVDAISECIFDRWGISFNNNRDSIRFLFPEYVVTEKRGSCVGMSLLYLLFAEKLGIPMHGVLAPGHLFVRYDNGNEQINIETLRRGECMTTAWYRQKYSITDTTLYSLRNLSTTELVAVVYYNIGTIELKSGHLTAAEDYLSTAIELFPDFPEAQGNLALVYDAMGDPRKALEHLLIVRMKHPAFKNIERNIASMQIKCGKYRQALVTYDSLVMVYSDDPVIQYGHAVALYQTGDRQRAAEACGKALKLRPAYREARELLRTIKE